MKFFKMVWQFFRKQEGAGQISYLISELRNTASPIAEKPDMDKEKSKTDLFFR